MTGQAPFGNEVEPSGWRGSLLWRDRARKASEVLTEQVPALAHVIRAQPFSGLDAHFIAHRGHYAHLPKPSLAQMRGVPDSVRPAYLSSLLLWQMDQFEERFSASGLHPQFAPHYIDSFHRIIDQILTKPEQVEVSKDSFLKDLWITRVVMIPALAQVWWPHSGLSLRQLASGGIDALSYCFLRCGGRRPFLEGHTHDSMVAQGHWTAQGWSETLRLAALALSTLRRHRGVFSVAWYFDPEVARISPRLAFLADLYARSGPHRFRVGTNAATIANATAKSATRRRLYAAGSYLPTDYCVVWGRANLLSAHPAPLGALADEK